MIDLTAAGAQLREIERRARDTLVAGCRSDVEGLERFMTRPLQRAKSAFNEGRLQADNIAQRCAWEVFANADVRARARFATYAATLAEAEWQFLGAARAAIAAPDLSLHHGRRITLPHLEIQAPCLQIPERGISQGAADEWAHALRAHLREALAAEIFRALHVVLRRGMGSLARTRIELRRASYERDVAL